MSNIILTKSNGTSDVTYTISRSTGLVSEYSDQSSGLTTPQILRVTHNLRPVGAKGTDRHTIALQKVVVETATGISLVGSVSLQISVPRSTDFTLAMVKDLIAQLTSYCNLTANVTGLFNGATPEGDFNVTGPFNPSIA
jgi:hypothetical protein